MESALPKVATEDDRETLLVGWTTLSNRTDALRLARTLVEESLVACAQIDGPVTSVYRWKNAVCEDEEWRLWLKFRPCCQSNLEKSLTHHHPYETFQWVVIRADSVAPDYLAWASEPPS
jgi:periplasmic divalent cation tolerance protein